MNTATTLIAAWFTNNEEARSQYLQASDRIFRDHGMIDATLFTSEEPIVGNLTPHAVVMVKWKDAHGARSAFTSPEYQKILGLRDQAFSKLDITLIAEQG